MKKLLSGRSSRIGALAGALAFGIVSPANAASGGLFAEPAVTYQVSKSGTDYPAPLSSSTGSLDGLGLGARLGFHLSETIFLAGDFRYAMPTYKDSNVLYDASAIATNYGVVLGLQMPVVGLRVWGTAVLGGELNPASSGSFDVKFQSATGYRVGTGFRLAIVSMNLEYEELKYGSATLEQIGPFAPGSQFDSVKMSQNSWIASVSFPLEL